MNRKDILIVARCFWPQCGPTELAISDLARNLKAAGHNVTVATVRWSKNWSENIDYHGIPVVRFAKPVSGPWSSFRYARLLSRHLSAKTYDGIIVSGLDDEAFATIRCVDDATPIIIRIDANQDVSRLHRKHIECCLGADAVVANSLQIASTLSRIDEMPTVHFIADGIQIERNEVNQSVRRHAREAFSAAHPVLQIAPSQKLAVTFTAFQPGSGILELVRIWPKVLERMPGSRLWLIGDGPDSSAVWQQILQLDIAHTVVMPGYFDNLNDLFAAADLYIHPSKPEAPVAGLIRAMASGLRIVSTDCQQLEDLLRLDPANRLPPNSDWSRVILDQLINSELYAATHEATETCQNYIDQHFSPAKQVAKYIGLIERAVADQVAVAK